MESIASENNTTWGYLAWLLKVQITTSLLKFFEKEFESGKQANTVMLSSFHRSLFQKVVHERLLSNVEQPKAT